jgi:Transposase DDE domain
VWHKLGRVPQTPAPDGGYGGAEFLSWLESRGIDPYIPLRKHYPSNARLYGIDRFTHHPETNSYECPEGKELKFIGIEPAVNRSCIYRSTQTKCGDCPRKAECTTGRYRQLVIHVEEAVRQRAQERTQQPAFFCHQRARRKIEAVFGELKNRIGLRRVRLRRLRHVREQFLMAATAQNLKRLVRQITQKPTLNGTLATFGAGVQATYPQHDFVSLRSPDALPGFFNSYRKSWTLRLRVG